jgi:hypothetical protein
MEIVSAAGRSNLTYCEYDGYDHAMRDKGAVDHQAEVLDSVGVWLKNVTR